ncbi:PREDICTED: PWWP domain-containing protein MUM1-like isoform X3 [Priapulus caudatus]|uniref:PWWP domain-containing protein MUM1-like isoform X3 n=1 Tax=Priapulus caudatus TaxID=37621 RepID=A0ABM1E0X5_PRICU|nr:PREDICTED: PWWP domain-containing protein MUM1-like isoform X3 [Priapulus caudatus]
MDAASISQCGFERDLFESSSPRDDDDDDGNFLAATKSRCLGDADCLPSAEDAAPPRHRSPISMDRDALSLEQDGEVSDTDSDSDSFPVFDMLLGTSPAAARSQYSESDIVWAKYRDHPLWPAVVRKCYHKKVSILFITTPQSESRRGMKMSLKNLWPFGCERHGEFKYADECFTRSSNPAAATTDTITLSDNSPAPSGSGNFRSRSPSPAGCGGITEKQCDERVRQPLLTWQDDHEGDSPQLTAATMRRISRRNDLNETFIRFIKSDEMKEYLRKIAEGTIVSKRHKNFCGPSARLKNGLKHCTGLGPFTDSDQIDDLLKYLTDLHKRLFGDTLTTCVDYVFEVWLPEAIIYCMRKKRKMSTARAEEYCLRGPFLTKEERKFVFC